MISSTLVTLPVPVLVVQVRAVPVQTTIIPYCSIDFLNLGMNTAVVPVAVVQEEIGTFTTVLSYLFCKNAWIDSLKIKKLTYIQFCRRPWRMNITSKPFKRIHL